MRRYGRRPYHRNYSRQRDGHEYAKEHIRQARKLSEELGGTDEDVKEYFFSLPRKELRRILWLYGCRYGSPAKEYAKKAMPLWQSGARHMSGLVAGRLYSLLPPRMPLTDKYRLVENLWKKYSPQSNARLRVGPDAPEEQVANAAGSHLLQVVTAYEAPEPLERRFSWLAAGDVKARTQLLNHFLQVERALIVKGTKERIPILLAHIRTHGEATQRLSQHLTIGRHNLEIRFDPKATGVRFEDPATPEHRSEASTYDMIRTIGCCVLMLLLLCLLVFTLNSC